MDHHLSRRSFINHATTSSAAIALALGRKRSLASDGSQRPIKIGQIGVGHSHAKGKMDAYRQSADFEVVGVVEANDEQRKAAQRDGVYAGLRWMSAEELLSMPDVEAVAVETNVEDLLDTAEMSIAAGKHIHLDKPPGSSLPQFRRVCAAADQQGLAIQMGYMYRYNPGVLLLRDLLKRGWLGEVFEIHAVMSKVVNNSKRALWSQRPGGTMFELGCHLVDLVVGVLGQPEQVTPYMQHVSPQNDGLLDNMLAVLRYPRALATVKSSALEVEGQSRRHFVVCGTAGTLHIEPLDSPSVRLALAEPHGKYTQDYQQIDVGAYDRYVLDAADFAQIIRGEKESDYPTQHDLAVQETLLEACGLSLD